MAIAEGQSSLLEHVHTILCEDVRFEMGPKLSLMGVIPNVITVQEFPVSLFKFTVVTRWRGEGDYVSEVRIVSADRTQHLVVSQPARFQLAPPGVAENITLFFHLTFPAAGQYWVQTLVDANLRDEQSLILEDARQSRTPPENFSESIN